MASFYFSEEQRHLVEQFAGANKPFEFNYELALFAAMVAADNDRYEELASGNRGQEIPDRIFIQNEKLGLIYLLALSKEQSSEILSQEKENEIWRIFEGYAQAGLSEMENWSVANPEDTDGFASIMEKITDKAKSLFDESKKKKPIDVKF